MVISKEEWFDNWEGNRRLTMRTIEAFPEEELFGYVPTAPLRAFSEMVKEILNIESAYMKGIAMDQWAFSDQFKAVSNKEDLLKTCDEVREETRKLWASMSEERLGIVLDDPFFGGPPQSHFERVQYALENEIHHRGQGFIYLRMLGIEPPAFYIR
ncbi:MAG TPA: DinB family protein [Bacillales bacterium]|nr:DinB family protein [Bacillales bacterium]